MADEADRETVDALVRDRKLRKRPSVIKGHLASGMTVAAARSFRQWVLEGDRNIKALEMGRSGTSCTAEERDTPGDRERAAELFRAALREAEAMGIPEAAQIRAVMKSANLA